MAEARRLKADDDEPLVIASEIMHREWFQWLLAQARLHEPPHRKSPGYEGPPSTKKFADYLEEMVAEGRPRGMTRDEAVWYLGHNLKRWNRSEAVEAAAKLFTARMVKIYEAECAARGIMPGHVESVPGKGWVVTGQSSPHAVEVADSAKAVH